MGSLLLYDPAFQKFANKEQKEKYFQEYIKLEEHAINSIETKHGKLNLHTATCEQCWTIDRHNAEDWCLVGLAHVLELKRIKGEL